jgi:hypothetical protein
MSPTEMLNKIPEDVECPPDVAKSMEDRYFGKSVAAFLMIQAAARFRPWPGDRTGHIDSAATMTAGRAGVPGWPPGNATGEAL